MSDLTSSVQGSAPLTDEQRREAAHALGGVLAERIGTLTTKIRALNHTRRELEETRADLKADRKIDDLAGLSLVARLNDVALGLQIDAINGRCDRESYAEARRIAELARRYLAEQGNRYVQDHP